MRRVAVAAALLLSVGAAHAKTPGIEPLEPKRSATVTITKQAVAGGLDKAIVMRYVRHARKRFVLCYENQLQAWPGLRGTSKVTYRIDEAGVPKNVVVSGLGNASVEDCVADALEALQYPKPKQGDVKVMLTLRYESAKKR